LLAGLGLSRYLGHFANFTLESLISVRDAKLHMLVPDAEAQGRLKEWIRTQVKQRGTMR